MAFQHVIFSGQIHEGRTISEVKTNIAKLFKLAPSQVDKLFCGKPVIIKKHVEAEVAKKYQAALEQAGAQVSLVDVDQENYQVPASEQSAPGTSGKQAQAQQAEPDTGQPQRAEALESVAQDSGTFSVEPAGADLLKPHEKQALEPVQVDISRLQLAPQEGYLVKDSEREQKATVQVDTSGLSLQKPD